MKIRLYMKKELKKLTKISEKQKRERLEDYILNFGKL